MQKSLCTFILCLSITIVRGQINYAADADKLYNVLQKTPSYKAQIKGDRADYYKQLVAQVKRDLPNAKTSLDRFYILSQLVVQLKDNHLYFYQVPDKVIEAPMLKDSAFIQQYRASAAYTDYPQVHIKLDSLENVLKAKPKDSLEGIYYYERIMKLGLYRTAKKDSLVGVVLQNYIPIWAPGQIAFILKEDRTDHFRAYHSHLLNKSFGLQNNEHFNHASLTESNWKKVLNEVDYINIPHSAQTFQFKTIDAQTQYLRLGSFATNTKNIALAQDFYDRIKDSVNAPTLIVDLRNNGGGGFKTSQRFLDLLKKHSGRGKVYAIVNNRSVSNTEQFMLKLKEFKNVIITGETTNGTVTYGNNYGTTETLPSGQFKIYITDMKEDGDFLQYEGIGIKPDIFLNPDTDWIQQVLGLIAKNKTS